MRRRTVFTSIIMLSLMLAISTMFGFSAGNAYKTNASPIIPAETKSETQVITPEIIQEPELRDQHWLLKHSIINESNTMNFTLYGVGNSTVYLQRYEMSENGWRTIHEETFAEDKINEQIMQVDITAPSEPGEVRYRILSNDQILASFDTINHDPADYTDYETIAYETIQEYCPNVFISTDNNEKMKERKVVGLAYTDENKIDLRSDMDEEGLKWVALHECGHILQHNTYDNNRADYSIQEKRSILWLNDELSPYYDEFYQNENGTGYSEKNADCIAYILSDTENAECIGNRRQAAYNIIQGKPVSSTIINENFANAVRLTNTGYAIEASECESVIKCSQKFENGIVDWELTDKGEKKLNFTPYDKTVKHARGYYFAPGIFDNENEGFSEYFGEES